MTTFDFNFSIFQKLQLKVIAFAANTRNFCHFLKNLWLVTLEKKSYGRYARAMFIALRYCATQDINC